MKLYVIDASAVGSPSPLVGDADALLAPELIDLEVANLLRKSVLRGLQTADEASAALMVWANNDVVRFPHAARLPAVWALRHTITLYDAAYVALAADLDATLLTADRRLAAAATRYCGVATVESGGLHPQGPSAAPRDAQAAR